MVPQKKTITRTWIAGDTTSIVVNRKGKPSGGTIK